jgi:hypothetical protein
MQVTPQEMKQLAAVGSPSREDLYAGIHKALRAFMADTLIAVGRADPTDAWEVANASERVMALMQVCHDHVVHENQFVHTALEARTPGICHGAAQDHDGHLQHIEALRTQALQLPNLNAGVRAKALHELYLALALFVADNFAHMHVEETLHNAALWAWYADDELQAIHGALVASIPPADMMLVMRWMLPQLNAPERLATLGGMRGSAPAPAFDAVLDMARPHLSPRDWGKLSRGLGLPEVPGLVETGGVVA